MSISSISNSLIIPSKSQEIQDIFSKYGIIGHHIDSTDDQGQTALAKATIAGDEQAVKILLSSGANKKVTDQAGYNILSLAVLNKHAHIAAILLESGVSIWDLSPIIRDSFNSTANAEMIRLFVEHGLPHRCT